jgi:uncharacterized DUF497 family protein
MSPEFDPRKNAANIAKHGVSWPPETACYTIL